MLSESSLFVFPHKVILKTCGTTTLLCAVSSIINIAKESGLVLIDDLWYSRRNYLEPQKQMEPHGSWKREVQFLDSIVSGSSFILGSTNSIHWLVFVTDKEDLHCATEDWGPEKGPLTLVSRPNVPIDSSSTFEVNFPFMLFCFLSFFLFCCCSYCCRVYPVIWYQVYDCCLLALLHIFLGRRRGAKRRCNF